MQFFANSTAQYDSLILSQMRIMVTMLGRRSIAWVVLRLFLNLAALGFETGSVSCRCVHMPQTRYVYIHKYTYIHTYISYIHTYIHTYMRLYVHTYMQKHRYTQLHTSVHIYITYVYIYKHKHAHVQADFSLRGASLLPIALLLCLVLRNLSLKANQKIT